MKKILVLVSLCMMLFLSGGCAKYNQIKPTSIDVVSLNPKGFRSIDVKLSVGIDNPAGKLQFYDVSGEAFLSGKVLGTVAVDPLTLKARTQDKYDLNAVVSLDEGLSLFSALGLIKDKESIQNIKVNIYAKVKVGGGAPKKIKLEDVPLNQLLKLVNK